MHLVRGLECPRNRVPRRSLNLKIKFKSNVILSSREGLGCVPASSIHDGLLAARPYPRPSMMWNPRYPYSRLRHPLSQPLAGYQVPSLASARSAPADWQCHKEVSQAHTTGSPQWMVHHLWCVVTKHTPPFLLRQREEISNREDLLILLSISLHRQTRRWSLLLLEIIDIEDIYWHRIIMPSNSGSLLQ